MLDSSSALLTCATSIYYKIVQRSDVMVEYVVVEPRQSTTIFQRVKYDDDLDIKYDELYKLLT